MYGILRRLALDALAVEVVRAFRGAGIEPILLKGRSIADRLYRGDARRTYRDVDLLVAPDVHQQAGQLLAGLGFTDALAGARADEQCRHAVTWVRRPGQEIVDLHFTLAGARADPAVVWSALCGHTRELRVGAECVSALDDVGLALHVALHAAHHGIGEQKPLADLARAVATFDRATMAAAAALAARIDAAPAFVAGLRLVPAGRALAATVGRGVDVPAATAARARYRVRGTHSISVVLAEPRWRRPIAAARLAFPSRTVLRRTTPLARRGRAGLVAAYAVRPLRMVVRLPAAVRAWRATATD